MLASALIAEKEAKGEGENARKNSESHGLEKLPSQELSNSLRKIKVDRFGKTGDPRFSSEQRKEGLNENLSVDT